MATVYSLICWGGSKGKTVTLALGTPCVATSTRHGVRDGTGVVLSTTGVLPTGLSSGVTYYAKSIAVNTFGLYSDSALSIPVVASGTQSGMHTITAKYFADLTPTERLQYGAVDNERIYDGLATFNAVRGPLSSTLDQEVCYIDMAFTEDLNVSALALSFNAAKVQIAARGSGAYDGTDGSGYILLSRHTNYTTPLLRLSTRIVVEGFTVKTTGVGSGLQLLFPTSLAYRMRVIGVVGASNYGVTPGAQAVSVVCCKVSGFSKGLHIAGTYFNQCVFAHNLAFGNTAGVSITSAVNLGGMYWGNISVDNTTNWPAQPTGIAGAGGNAGAGTDTPWTTAGNASVVVSPTDFINSAAADYRPASSDSPQVDTALTFYGQDELSLDIAGNVRPDYNNGGAEAVDIGCYEYDHGFGPRPASTTVTFAGVNAGSEIRVYDASGNELAGIESSSASQSLTWTVAIGDQRIVIVHLDYKIKDFAYSNVPGNIIIPIQQERDTWFNNPI